MINRFSSGKDKLIINGFQIKDYIFGRIIRQKTQEKQGIVFQNKGQQMIRSINHSSRDYIIQVTGVTWKKNFQDLFDYDQHSNEQLLPFSHQLIARETFFLIWRNKKTLQLSMQTKRQLKKINQQGMDPNVELLCGGKISLKEKIFQIKLYQPDEIFRQPKNQNNVSSRYFNEHHFVVRSLISEDKQPLGYQLKSNNLIKLGSCEFFIHLVHVKTEEDQSLQSLAASLNLNMKHSPEQFLNEVTFFINNNEKVYDADMEKNPPEAQCKYCMMSEIQKQGDFLCSPCTCSGSCGLVHFGCLVQWNKNKVKKTENKGCIEYNFEKFFCEVCKAQYPQYIKKKKKIHQILPMEKPKGDFIVIEALNSLKRHIIIVENTDNEGLVIGRGQQSGLKIDDPTISRRHCIIKKEGKDFRIFDLKSKFGTLVRDVTLIFPLKKGDKFSIQSGGSVLSFALMKKSSESLFQS